jgi:hypothetical protein
MTLYLDEEGWSLVELRRAVVRSGTASAVR